jgi:hypothetical protein
MDCLASMFAVIYKFLSNVVNLIIPEGRLACPVNGRSLQIQATPSFRAIRHVHENG